ncbi:hypothetical protein RA210_U20255 [Rubrivivax sp. A210]|uniref:hypothetical protein n=1 Tax=Rubrivivax sp. A210 TaxID=2772301 RepID=UPI001918E84A|nr:hypothetical protein [Rubrivivax sp. A210]CAD5372272.1 hypothetical protein RA210_U20255 [Rubrivivax sp. A210]
MDIKKSDRTALKSYFVKNAVPTAGNFADLIDGMLNQKEDGIAKLAGEPLSLQADGDDNSQKKAINFYKFFADAKPAWTIALRPRANPNDAATARAGFSVSDGDGNSRLYIDQNTGNVGVGTVSPEGYRLHVAGGPAFVNGANLMVLAENAGRLRVGAAWGMPGVYSGDDGAKPLMLGAPPGQRVFLGSGAGDAYVEGGSGNAFFRGNLGVGTPAPNHKFHVVAPDAVGLFESSGSQAFLRISTNEGLGNRVELANRPGGRLALWTAGGSDVLSILRDGSVGIGTTTPVGRLEVNGTASVSNGVGFAVRNGFMAPGSLTIGGTNANYGGGNLWSPSTAGLMLEAQSNTEIAVHDAGTRLTSLMYFEGDAINRVTIGRDMGWGPLNTLLLNGNVGIGSNAPRARLEVAGGAIMASAGSSGAAGIQFSPNPGGGGGDEAGLRFFARTSEHCTLELFVGNDPQDHIALISSGNVGIGTREPANKLDVAGDVAIHGKHAFRGSDTWLRINQDRAFTSGTHVPGVLAPESLNVGGWSGWGNPGAGNAAITGNLGTRGWSPTPRTNGWVGGIHTWDIEAEGTVWSRNGYQTGPRDLAENYASLQTLEAGELVSLDPEADRIVRAISANDPLLLGIVSTQPGFLLNVDHEFQGGTLYPVALCGRVPCKVVAENGAIKRGDLLTSSSTPGHAMRATPVEVAGQSFYRPGTIIGKALDPLTADKGLIDVFVFSS